MPEKMKENKNTQGAGMMLLDLVKHVLFHNGWMKLLAILISVILLSLIHI